MRKINVVPLFFILLSFLGYVFSQMSLSFVLNEVIIRFIRDGILVLALIIPVVAGMGLNFAITVGAIAAQVGYLVVLDWKIGGYPGFFLAAAIGSLLSILLGYVIGICLNMVKGKEMITTIIIGFLATSIYQFIFLVCYGTILPVHNQEILLSRKIGCETWLIWNLIGTFLIIFSFWNWAESNCRYL